MSKKEFYNSVLADFFLDLECSIADLEKMLKPVLPIFGECVLDVIDQKDGKKIKVIDKDVADIYVCSESKGVSEEDLDMSTVPLVIYTDKEGVINFIEHGYTAFTKANKENVLFISSLIGKKIVCD